MEAFEKELNEAKAKDGEGEDADGAAIDEVDEADLGDDPFARSGGEAASVDAGGEAWLGSDRDYTYSEVRIPLPYPLSLVLTELSSSSSASTPNCMPRTPPS